MSIYGNSVGGGSGSNGLNFKVVGGTTQPTNPCENTIWVDTDIDITSWFFDDYNPYVLIQTYGESQNWEMGFFHLVVALMWQTPLWQNVII